MFKRIAIITGYVVLFIFICFSTFMGYIIYEVQHMDLPLNNQPWEQG